MKDTPMFMPLFRMFCCLVAMVVKLRLAKLCILPFLYTPVL